jgi:hypothetical protein
MGIRTQKMEPQSDKKTPSQEPENVARILHMTKQFRK